MTENETLKNRLAELSKQNTLLADHLASIKQMKTHQANIGLNILDQLWMTLTNI